MAATRKSSRAFKAIGGIAIGTTVLAAILIVNRLMSKFRGGVKHGFS